MNQIQKPEIQRKIHTSLWILKISRKNLWTKSLKIFAKCDFQTENHT